MTTNVLISNLPQQITKEELEEYFAGRGNEVEVELIREGNPDKVTAKVKMNVDNATAQIIAEHARNRFWHGRKITVHVPLDKK